MGVETTAEKNVTVTSLDIMVNRARRSSLWPMQ